MWSLPCATCTHCCALPPHAAIPCLVSTKVLLPGQPIRSKPYRPCAAPKPFPFCAWPNYRRKKTARRRYLWRSQGLGVFTRLVRWRFSGLQFGEAVASMSVIDTAVLLGLGGPKQHLGMELYSYAAPHASGASVVYAPGAGFCAQIKPKNSTRNV